MGRTDLRFTMWFLSSLVVVSPGGAETPTVTGQVLASGGVTRYVYTVTNDLPSGRPIPGIQIEFPLGSVGPMLGHSEPLHWIYQFRSSGGGSLSWSVAYKDEQSMLKPGQSIAFEIWTSFDVETRWDFMPFGNPNWTWLAYNGTNYDWYVGDHSLPVPVPIPEPSSLLALAYGLGGVAVLRRKRK